MLEVLDVQRVELEEPGLAERLPETKQLDAVLDLVGNSTIMDSLDMLRRGGRACLAGWLGGLAPIADFNPLAQMASGVYLTFFASFVFGKPGFPLSDVPLQAIAARWRRAVSRRSPRACSDSRRSARHIASWRPTRPRERWSSSTNDRPTGWRLCGVIGAFISIASIPMTIVLLVAIFTVHVPNGFSPIKLQSVDASGAHFGQPR